MPETPETAARYGRRDMDELYRELVDPDESGSAAAVARVAWDLYAQLGTVAAEVTSLRARLHSNPLSTAA